MFWEKTEIPSVKFFTLPKFLLILYIIEFNISVVGFDHLDKDILTY